MKTYIRVKVDGKRTFKAAPTVPDLTADYWIRYQVGNKQQWKKVGPYADLKKAIMLLEREKVAKQYNLTVPATIGRLSLPEAVEAYIQHKVKTGKRPDTIVAYRFTLNLFAGFCPRLYVDEVKGEDLLEFAVFCKKRGDGERTVSNKFVDVAGFLKFHGKGGLVPVSDWPTYTERRVESYTEEEIEAFYTAAKTEKQWVLLDLLINTGFRIGELANLTWADVDFAGNKLHVTPKPQWDWKPKTNEVRTVRVPQKVMDNLKAYRLKATVALVFPNAKGTPDEHLLRIIEDLGTVAGITGRCDCHKFRSSFATSASGKFKIQDVQSMLGHKNIATTMRYLAVSDLDDADYVAKIEGTIALRVPAHQT